MPEAEQERRKRMRAGLELTGKYRFDEFELSSKRRVLDRAGQRVPLPPKPLEILICLVERAGQTVSKEQLFDEIWNGAAVEENNLTQYISTLRKILGEKRGENRYIVTDPGRGYRFVAHVAKMPEAVSPEHSTLPDPELKPPSENRTLPARARFWRHGVAAVLIVLGISLVAWRWPARSKPYGLLLAVLPFQDAGAKQDPALADGFTDEVTMRLSQAWKLPVVSRNSAFQFRGK